MFEIYKDRSGEWRWRLRAHNGKIIADSSESYGNKLDCERGIELVRQLSTTGVTVDDGDEDETPVA